LKTEDKWNFRNYLLAAGAILVWSSIASVFELQGIGLSRITKSLLNFVVTSFFAFYVLPRKRGVPFGKVSVGEFLSRFGIYQSEKPAGHILLGVILATLSLSGMFVGSMMSGLYVFDSSTIDVSQIVFSVNPGLWEELFFRGVLMILLLRNTKSLRKATLLQVIIFSLFHIRGLDLWGLVDVLSVSIIALGFTYTAYKTRSLIPGIVFHFLHDAFLFVVQVPRDIALTNTQNMVFFVSLWAAIGIGCLITKVSAERFGIQEKMELYKN